MKRKDSRYPIRCDPNYGPRFGYDIFLSGNCNKTYSCCINNDGTNEYECHSEYKTSLFVNTNEPNEKNRFTVLDYEVYCIDYNVKSTFERLCKYPNIIWEYYQTKDISEESLKQVDDEVDILNDLDTVHCSNSALRVRISQHFLKNPSEYLLKSQLVDKQYDDTFKQWFGNQYICELIYRASEHKYSAESFHEYCDDKGPTLIIIKSSGGWIFGGYTTQSWATRLTDSYDSDDSGDLGYRKDSEAFIFTLKNPHGVEPTRFVKREESEYAIRCNLEYGPIFCGNECPDICIYGYFNEENNCWIENDGNGGYDCHPQYKSSLFVNTAGPNNDNYFSVLDYEVYTFNVCKEYVYNTCKHPDIICEYIQTKDISEESLKPFDDDVELLNDLDVIHCNDSSIRLRISYYYLKNPSELLYNTKIIKKQYDSYLREWAGEYKWKLSYRASENGYTTRSFHEYCDNVQGPTLVVIKSSGGWIFGGYTTQSWKYHKNFLCIYNDMVLAFNS